MWLYIHTHTHIYIYKKHSGVVSGVRYGCDWQCKDITLTSQFQGQLICLADNIMQNKGAVFVTCIKKGASKASCLLSVYMISSHYWAIMFQLPQQCRDNLWEWYLGPWFPLPADKAYSLIGVDTGKPARQQGAWHRQIFWGHPMITRAPRELVYIWHRVKSLDRLPGKRRHDESHLTWV